MQVIKILLFLTFLSEAHSQQQCHGQRLIGNNKWTANTGKDLRQNVHMYADLTQMCVNMFTFFNRTNSTSNATFVNTAIVLSSNASLLVDCYK